MSGPRDADPKSSFGDMIALSQPVDRELADVLARVISDGVIAPGYEPGVAATLAGKKAGAFLVLEADPGFVAPPWERRDRRDDPYGASPRFGSAYLRLRPEATARATFCWPDSAYHPEAIGGPEKLKELCRLADRGVLDRSAPPASAAELPLEDPLNDYVEAHVHGGLSISRDVEALVVDPSDHEAHAGALGQIGCRILIHPGYRVTADAIDPDFRGPVPVELALELGGGITPARLAAASRSGNHSAQAVKWLWHCLARYGRHG